MIERAIRSLNFDISYFSHRDFITRELYKNAPFVVVFDRYSPQLVDKRFKINFLDLKTFELSIDEEDVKIYSFKEEKYLYTKDEVNLKGKFKVGEEVKSEYFSFKVLVNNDVEISSLNGTDFFFSFNSMPHLIKSYGNDLSTTTTSRWASVVLVDLNTKNVAKGTDFLNELMDQYMQDNLEKKNHFANITMEYIKNQLGKISDTLNFTAKKMEDYRARNQVFDINTKAQTLTAQLQTLETQKPILRYATIIISTSTSTW
ncbi:MAG: hypothetical protein HC896_08605 [Bacteroidales bacterium]|nr:hypothetical protein [Bacteroidales bacterium]